MYHRIFNMISQGLVLSRFSCPSNIDESLDSILKELSSMRDKSYVHNVQYEA